MNNPKYSVSIGYVNRFPNGTQELNVNGTFSVPTYGGDYFVASMPEILISATGTSYNDALNKLLIIATSSSIPGSGFSN